MNNNNHMNGDITDGPYQDAIEENPILLQYWQAAMRHKIAVSAIIAVSIALGLVITLLATPYYTSTARVEINREQDRITNVEGVDANDGTTQNLEFYETQYALLEARSLAERVARDRNLASRDEFFDAFNIDTSAGGVIVDADAVQNKDERNRKLRIAIGILQDNITISPVVGSSLVDIEFSSPDPSLSEEISNAWVEQFVAANLARRFSSTADARKFLEEQLADLKGKLEISEKNLNSYSDTKEIITISEQRGADGAITSQRTLSAANLEALNEALIAAKADRILAQSATQQKEGNSAALNNTTLNTLRGELATLRAEYSRLLVQFEPEYPALQALNTQINSLSRSIAAEENRSRTGTQARYLEALAREKKLSSELETLKQKFSTERRDSIQYDIFRREVDTNRQLYDGLLQRYKEIGVAGVATNNISVIDRGQKPSAPSSPILLLNLVLAAMIGVGIAAAYVFITEQIDQTIKEPSDLKAKLGLAVLGSIPDIESEQIIDSLEDKKSVAWEAYLSIRTSLSFLTDHGVPRTMLFTSSRPNEGKSTSAYAIASVLASNNHKVLLIDGDMRNPSLHGLLGGKNEYGLSNFLSGSDNIDKMIVERDGFDAVTAGPIPPNAAELLGNNRLDVLLKALTERYDTVIIDAPPVLGLADIPLLARAVEGVIYTVEAGGVKVRDIQSALSRIQSVKAHIFGGIVTKIPSKSAGYGYAYEYSYGNKPSK